MWLLALASKEIYGVAENRLFQCPLTQVKGEEHDGGALAALERVRNHRMWKRAGECRLTSPGSFSSESVFFLFC